MCTPSISTQCESLLLHYAFYLQSRFLVLFSFPLRAVCLRFTVLQQATQ